MIFIIYVVKENDTLSKIAKEFNVDLDTITTINQLENPNNIVPGQAILIPKEKFTDKKGTLEINGFIYPTIDKNVLEKEINYLTFLNIFSFRVNESGKIIEKNIEKLMNYSNSFDSLKILTITNTEENGKFNSDIAKIILNDYDIQIELLNEIYNIVKKYSFKAVNFDFEYIYPDDRENYNNFLENMVYYFHNRNILVFTSLAPKTSDEQSGLLYSAHDYEYNGKICDRVILMTYEWGYKYGPPQAIAPLDKVEKVLKYALTKIPKEKILLGIPNYAYDWKLPYNKKDPAKTIGLSEAINLADNKYSQIVFDKKAQSPYFNYIDENKIQHIVWFEDVKSIDKKLELALKYKIAGVSYWNINTYFAPNWYLLKDNYFIKKII